jgi:predicted nucleic acid-binding protein
MLYLDASAFAKLYLAEDGGELMRELWSSDVPVVSSWVTYAETRAALSAARRSRRLSPSAATAAARRFQDDWDTLNALTVDGATCRVAGELVGRHHLRGVDGVHLAASLPFREARVLFVTFDARLARAAVTEGLAVAGVPTG